MGSTRRTKRIGALIQSELGELLLQRVHDPRLRQLSITSVDVSPDLSQAKVYYSLWEEDRQEEVDKGFTAAAGFLRRELAKRLKLKTVPRLIPHYDSSLANGARLTEVIKEARAEDEIRAGQRGEDSSAGEDETC